MRFAITYIVILTCVMFLNLIISLSVLWIDNDIIAYIALQKQPVLCWDIQRQKVWPLMRSDFLLLSYGICNYCNRERTPCVDWFACASID